MSTTMLSKCGGFVTRRNNQMLARNELSSVLTARSESLGNRLQEPIEQATAATTTATTTAPATTALATSAFACPRLCAQQSYSLLSCGSYFGVLLLLILSASYLPSGSALPRRALGRHLILPHRHHVHLRSAGQEHKHKEYLLVYKKKLNCTMNTANFSSSTLRHALNVVIGTRQSTIELMTSCFKGTEEELAQRYRLHHLNLDYPLKAAVNNSEYDGQGTDSLEKDLLNIYHSLVRVGKVLAIVNETVYEQTTRNYFQFFVEKVEHNIFNAANFLSCVSEGDDHIPDPFNRHPCPEYVIVNEFVQLLNVIEKKYGVMLRQQEAVEAAAAAQAED